MVFSVDDLVSSLSNNHIGQEAIDLAALHAQLAQALFTQQSAPVRPSVQIKPCTTPTSTMSYSWNHVSPIGMDDMEYQDERMVEELLIPGVQTPTQNQTQAHPLSLYPLNGAPEEPPRHTRCQVQSTFTSDHFPAFDPPSCSSPSSPSFFTSKDPFYIAQLQETQIQARAWNDGQGHNTLARLGKPDEASPFLLVSSQTQAQTPQQAHYQRPGESGAGGGDSYSAVSYADLLYQREQMLYYHHQYCPATAVGS